MIYELLLALDNKYISVVYKGELSDIMTVLTKMVRHSYKKLNRYLDIEHLAEDFLITENEQCTEIHLPIVAEFLTTYRLENEPIYQSTLNGQIITMFPISGIDPSAIHFRVIKN